MLKVQYQLCNTNTACILEDNRKNKMISLAVSFCRVQVASCLALDLKKAHYKEIPCQVKTFRHQVNKGLLIPQEVEEKRKLLVEN
jgi:hypothetical protein